MPWNPDQYHKFQTERAAPFEDLARLVPARPAMRVVDLGCGTGELTARLADMLPGSEVVGIDTSAEMLERAQRFERHGLRFTRGAIEDLSGEWDLIFSHAALQWVDDHRRLVPRLLERLRPDGQLAVQMPSNHGHPAHLMIKDVAAEPPFAAELDGWRRASPVLSIDEYAQLLFDHGCTDLTVYEKVYPHLLADADALAEWMSGTALVPYFDRLPGPLHEPFLDRYRHRLRQHWNSSPVFFGFRRTLLAAAHP